MWRRSYRDSWSTCGRSIRRPHDRRRVPLRISAGAGCGMNKPTLNDEVKKAAAAADAEPVKPTNFLLGPEKSRPSTEQLFGVPYETPLIIEEFLMRDADIFASPGGLGKSTLTLYQAAHIITGRPLFGHTIVRRGGVLVISAEDSVDNIYSRLNKICQALDLTKKDRKLVQDNFYAEDVSEVFARLVSASPRNGVEQTGFIEEIIAKGVHPVAALHGGPDRTRQPPRTRAPPELAIIGSKGRIQGPYGITNPILSVHLHSFLPPQ
jgi:hypothetical protein